MRFLNNNKVSLLCAGLLFTSVLFVSCDSENDQNSAESGTAELNVNLDMPLQTMESFGASDAWQCNFIGKNWPSDKRNKIADLLFSKDFDADGNPKGIGLSLWRFNIGAGSSEQGDASDITDEWRRTECFTTDGVSYNMNKQAGQVWFMKAARERGVEKLLAFANSAPVYLTQNGKAHATIKEFYNLKDGKMPDLADFWANALDKLKTEQGLTIDYVSPFNEPQYEWDGTNQEGSPATNANIYNFVNVLSPKLQSKGVEAQIVVGEAGAYEPLYKTVSGKESRSNQVDYFFGANSAKKISGLSNVKKTISAHSYWQAWPLNEMVSSRQLAASRIQGAGNISLWSSEYCVLESPGTAELPGGAGAGRDLGMSLALWTARIINTDIAVGGVTSWQWWTAISRGDYKDGLIHVDDGASNGAGNSDYCKNDGYIRDSKTLWALGNFSFFVKPGMVRVQIPSVDNATSVNDVMVTAYKDAANKKLVVVAVNISKSAKAYKLNLAGGALVDNKLTPYTTSETLSLKKGTAVDAANIQIPARAVVTFVGTYK
ncbi:O-Glycosyl hydrolase [Flavobacterium sp. CF108]|uniref:glycoside hydrolase n=1 Tax=unclassified Flavobacterium TaxID=196869 RepID=UPI0008C2A0A6|nr:MULTISPECIES: glycoside hydrolase [unclassified Flavobacterium]SEO63592.1 O-Glycosyl hydrolase [Flavobacterium sp. fv08]SHI06759.1 O-Glycosyl hydrolase [Flavobacterium sp. CF108]